MYLIQERQIKTKRLGRLGAFYTRLPSLNSLDSINYYAIRYGFLLLSIGMITGSIVAQGAHGSYWLWDPKEVWSLITWLCYAILLHQRMAIGWRGREPGQPVNDWFVCLSPQYDAQHLRGRQSSRRTQRFLTYLRFAKKPLGLLINFNEVLLKDGITRIINAPKGADGWSDFFDPAPLNVYPVEPS